jgi:hypothetical protein
MNPTNTIEEKVKEFEPILLKMIGDNCGRLCSCANCENNRDILRGKIKQSLLEVQQEEENKWREKVERIRFQVEHNQGWGQITNWEEIEKIIGDKTLD